MPIRARTREAWRSGTSAGATEETLTLRLMRSDDLRLLHDWLQRAHVRKWWGLRLLETIASVERKYLPRIRGETHVTPYLALLGSTPVGYCQAYQFSEDAFWRDVTDPNVRGCDQFLGDATLLGRGLGTRMVQELVRTLHADPAVTTIQTDPSTANARAIRCYEKAGFRRQGVVATPDGPSLLMVHRRPAGPA